MNGLDDNTVLLIIDVQKGFDNPAWGKRNNLQTEENVEKLLGFWRESKRPIYHVRHLSNNPSSPLHVNSAGSEIKEGVKPLPEEPLITKHVNSAFIGTNLERQLKDRQYDTLVIVGLTTDHCVSTTTRMAANLGFNTYIVSDATATFDRVGPGRKHYKAEEIHNINLVSLNEEFATVIDTAGLTKQLL